MQVSLAGFPSNLSLLTRSQTITKNTDALVLRALLIVLRLRQLQLQLPGLWILKSPKSKC